MVRITTTRLHTAWPVSTGLGILSYQFNMVFYDSEHDVQILAASNFLNAYEHVNFPWDAMTFFSHVTCWFVNKNKIKLS